MPRGSFESAAHYAPPRIWSARLGPILLPVGAVIAKLAPLDFGLAVLAGGFHFRFPFVGRTIPYPLPLSQLTDRSFRAHLGKKPSIY